MGSITTLTAVIVEAKNADFNEQYRALTTQEGEGFTVGIKEYIDGKRELTEKIKILNTKKATITSDLVIQKKSLFDQATKRYEEGGDWIKLETHNGKEVTHAQVSYEENLKKVNIEAEKLHTKKDLQIKTLNEDLEKFETSFDSVVWAWNLAYSRSGLSATRNFAYDKGLKEITLVLYQHLQGGGFAWVEPFFEGSNPTCSTKNGLFVHTVGTSSDIVIAEWYGYDKDKKPVKINQPVAPTDKVQLHIYTKSMYGQNIGVELKANGKTLKANSYSNNFYLYASKNPDTKPKESETKYEVMDSKDLFLAEVEVYDYSDPNSIQPPAGAVTGSLIKQGDDFSDESIKPIPNVQKAVLDLYIDPAWCFGLPEITINPTIHFGETIKTLAAPLKIFGHKNPDMRIPETGNMPVFVDKVETNFQAFQHCGYDSIKISNKERKVLAFDKNIGKPVMSDFEVVAGTIFTQEIKIELDDSASTLDCLFENDVEKDHENHVFAIVKYPEMGIAKVEEQNKKSDFSIKSETKIKIGKDVTTERGKHMIYLDDINLKINTKTDKILIFQSRFIFDTTPVLGQLPYILRYFWIGKGANTCNYLVNINSCRYNLHPINIVVYPDVRWGLRLEYKNLESEYIKSSKEILSNQTYKDTSKAKFKREPVLWIDAGKRKFGLCLKVKFNNKPGQYQLDSEKTTSSLRNEGEEWDITQNVSDKITEMVKPINMIADFLEKTMDGKNNKKGSEDEPTDDNKAALEKVKENKRDSELEKLQNNFKSNADKLSKYPKDSKEYNNAVKDNASLQRKMDSRAKTLGVKLMRSPLSWEIYWPEFGLEFDWSRIPIKNGGYESKFNKTGVFLEGIIEAKPIIGAKIVADFLALAQRAHPLALALIAAADIAMAIIGNGSKITLELSFQGILAGKIQGFLNTETGENTFNGSKDRDANNKPISELSVELIAKITASVKLAMSKRAIFIVVNVEMELSLEAEAKFYVKTLIDYDDDGFFISPELTFEGIQFKGKANIKGSAGKDEKNPLLTVDSKNEFIYQAIDRQPSRKIGKIYFKKFDN